MMQYVGRTRSSPSAWLVGGGVQLPCIFCLCLALRVDLFYHSLSSLGVEVGLRYDTIVEFNVDSKAECDQLNLAHETKTKNASAYLVRYRFKIREGRPGGIRRLWRKGFVKEMSFKSGVKD